MSTDRGMPRRDDVTLKDVARAAKVSLMTVSNVVNGRYGSMARETRERVERAIAGLNYRPKAHARALRLERNMTAGMLILDPARNFLSDPFISQVVAGFSNRLGDSGYGCLVHGVSPQKFEESIFLRLAHADGLCVFLSGTNQDRRTMIMRLADLGEPIVAVGDSSLGFVPNVSIVRQDDRGGGRALTQRLLEQGARSFTILLPEILWPAMEERLVGMREAFAATAGVSYEEVHCAGGRGWSANRETHKILGRRKRPDAIIAGTDQIGSGAALALSASPHKLLLGAFRSVEFFNYTYDRLVAATGSSYELGERTGELLLRLIEQSSVSASELILPITISNRPLDEM